MKAFVTVIDDNGNIICKDNLFLPIKEEVISKPHKPAIKEARFSFVVRQLVDFQTLEVEDANSN